MKPQPSDLLGRSIRDVMIELERLKLDFRLVKVNGKSNPVRYDCIYERYNLEIEGSTVVLVWMG